MPLTLDPPRNEAQAPAARVRLPDSYNYIGAFLTFQCPYRCSYCINRFHEENALGYERRSGREWIAFSSAWR